MKLLQRYCVYPTEKNLNNNLYDAYYAETLTKALVEANYSCCTTDVCEKTPLMCDNYTPFLFESSSVSVYKCACSQ